MNREKALNINKKKFDNSRIVDIKRCTKRVIVVFVVVACIIGMTKGLNYLLVKPEEWHRFLMHHFYNREEDIDSLFLGSSHVFCDVNPDIMDRLTENKHFNLSTNSQTFVESYLLLQEADKKYNVQTVYLEMYYKIHIEEEDSYRLGQYFRSWDYVKTSFSKQQLIMEQKPGEELAAVYFPFVRYRKYIFDGEHISSQIRTKTSDAYKNLNYQKIENANGNYTFLENGHAKYEMALEDDALKWERVLLPSEPLVEDAYTYLIKIIDYCKENQIELILFSSPMYDLQVCSMDAYDNYVRQIEEIAATYDLEYYDFNLCKEEYLPIQKKEYFKDVGHLNADGAELFTTVLCDVVMNNRKDYFYDSYKDKLEKTHPTIYGLFTESSDENDKITYEIASNRETDLEYRIEFIPDERDIECEVIQEYNRNKGFTYVKDVEGSFLVSARLIGEKEPFIELIIDN